MKQNPKHKGTQIDSQLRALTSLNQVEFDELLSVFGPFIEKKQAHYTLKGKRRVHPCFVEYSNSSLYGSERKLEFILMYLKHNPTQSFQGYCFGLSQSKTNEWISYLLPVLYDSLAKLGFMPQSGDYWLEEKQDSEYFLMDVTERIVPERTDQEAQKVEYSGKKRLHTVKNLAITDPEGYVLFLSDTYEGSMHDRAIWKELEIADNEKNILADLGFLGAEKNQGNLILPFRKPRKSKTNDPELRDTQKQLNQAISRLRVRIEHAFAAIKRLKIVGAKIRLRAFDSRDLVMKIATAIHNMRMSFRKYIRNHS